MITKKDLPESMPQGEVLPNVLNKLNIGPRKLEEIFSNKILLRINDAQESLKGFDDGYIFFVKKERLAYQPTEVLIDIISKTYQESLIYLNKKINSEIDLKEIQKSTLAESILLDHIDKIFTVLVERARIKNIQERGGYDRLMKGFIFTKSEMGPGLLSRKLSEVLQGAQKASLYYFDLDNFKQVNDQYGHDIGDAALMHMAKIAHDSMRTKNPYLLARDGGEECFAILTQADGRQAIIAAERFRENLEANPLYVAVDVDFEKQGDDTYKRVEGKPVIISKKRFNEIKNVNNHIETEKFGEPFKKNDEDEETFKRRGDRYETNDPRYPVDYNKRVVIYKIPLTVSIGISEFPVIEGYDLDAIKKQADKNVYQAKNSGRNGIAWKGKRVSSKDLSQFKEDLKNESVTSLPAVDSEKIN